MSVRIADREGAGPLDVIVSVPGHVDRAVSLIAPPLADGGDTELLRWYLEDRLATPGLDSDREAAAVQAIDAYGTGLWTQLFDTPAAARSASTAAADGVEVVGHPPLQALFWELLRDPLDLGPLALRAPMVRRARGAVPAPAGPGSGGSVLLVTSRPGGDTDVAYRTVSGRLADTIAAPYRLEVLAPTVPALRDRLTRAAEGGPRVGVVHIDAHADLFTATQVKAAASRARVTGATDFTGRHPFVLFETEHPGLSELVTADALGELLASGGVTMVVLTACRSATASGPDLTSMCHLLAAAGVASVLGMGHRVSVTAVEMLVGPLYRALLGGVPLSEATTSARQVLADASKRRAHFGRDIDIQDWWLPVVYEQAPARTLRAAGRVQVVPLPALSGRDLDVQALDRMLDRSTSRHLLVRGMLGTGKSMLLRHQLAWWTRTGRASDHAVLSVTASVRGGAQAVIAAIAAAVGAPVDELRYRDIALGLDDVDALLALPGPERATLAAFLNSLTGGAMTVLHAARGSAAWLAPSTFGHDVHTLGPLDPVASAALTATVTATLMQPPLVSLTREQALAGIPGVVRALTARDDHDQAALLTALLGDTPDRPLHLDEVTSVVQLLEAESLAALSLLTPLTGTLPLALLDPFAAELGMRSAGLEHLTFALMELDQIGLARETRPGHVDLHPLLLAHLRSTGRPDPHLEQAWAATWLREAAALWSADQLDTAPGLRAAARAAAREHLPNLERAVRVGIAGGQDVTMGLGVVASMLGSDNRWAETYELGITAATGLRAANASQHAVGAAVDLQGYALLHLGRTVEAEQRYTEALDLFADTPELAASIHHQLGRIAQERDLDTAERRYQRALELTGRTGQIAGRSVQQLGRLAQERHRPDLARELFTEAATIFETIGDQPSQSTSLYQGAVAAQEADDLDAAADLSKQARALRRLLGDRIGAANCRHQMSIIHEKRGNLPAADREARQARAEYARAGHPPGEAETLLRLAELATTTAPVRLEEADHLLESALDILGDTPYPVLRARLHSQRGQILTRLDRPAAALPHTARALLIRSWQTRPEGDDIYWLDKQHAALSDKEFARILAAAIGYEPAAQLIRQQNAHHGEESTA